MRISELTNLIWRHRVVRPRLAAPPRMDPGAARKIDSGLEIKLQSELEFTRVAYRAADETKSARPNRGRVKERIGVREIRVIESVKRFGAEFEAHGFPDREGFENAQIHVAQARAMISSHAAIAKRPLGRDRKSGGIQPGAAARIVGRAGARIAYAIRTCQESSRTGLIDCVKLNGGARLGRNDRIHLPSAKDVIDRAFAVHHFLAVSERQFVRYIPNDPVTNVEYGIAAFRGVVIGILQGTRRLSGCPHSRRYCGSMYN